MTANTTGRTVSKWVLFVVDGVDGTLRSLPVNSINGVGLDYPTKDLTAWIDAIKSSLPETPECKIEIEGPFDINAAQAVASGYSGSHTILSGYVDGRQTAGAPLSLDIRIGMRHAWEATEPQFGITGTATNGFYCSSYIVDLNNSSYKATFEVFAGSAVPEWGTAAET